MAHQVAERDARELAESVELVGVQRASARAAGTAWPLAGSCFWKGVIATPAGSLQTPELFKPWTLLAITFFLALDAWWG